MLRAFSNWLRGKFSSTRKTKKQAYRRPTSYRPSIELLEDRTALSWGGTPPAYESMFPLAMSPSIALNNQGDIQIEASITQNEVDYYRLTAPTTGGYRLEARTPYSNLDTVMAVYNGGGRRLAYNDDALGIGRDSQVSMNLTAGQSYYIGVTNYQGTGGGRYTLIVDGPTRLGGGGGNVGGMRDDRYEENDSIYQASDLGTFNHTDPSSSIWRGYALDLVMADNHDWFRFKLQDGGRSGDYVSISFQHSQGDLDLGLYNSSGQLIRNSIGVTNEERISLAGLSAGSTYYIDAYGYRGATNPDYSLTVNTRGSSSNTSKTLYVNFDGAPSISRTDLVRWAGSDWSGSLGFLDAEGDGIRVQSFLTGSSSREAIISQTVQLLQSDLAPFGITVQRRTGLAVENQGATTVFVGQDNIRLSFGGIACDIDYGNNNRTDIAFVRPVTGSTNGQTATMMADLILHEAGHTYGLYHVSSPYRNEAMGLGYSIGAQAGMDAAFVNQSFPEYVDANGLRHGGGRGPQNSYQVMNGTFVTGTVRASAASSAPSSYFLHYDSPHGPMPMGHDDHDQDHVHEQNQDQDHDLAFDHADDDVHDHDQDWFDANDKADEHYHNELVAIASQGSIENAAHAAVVGANTSDLAVILAHHWARKNPFEPHGEEARVDSGDALLAVLANPLEWMSVDKHDETPRNAVVVAHRENAAHAFVPDFLNPWLNDVGL